MCRRRVGGEVGRWLWRRSRWRRGAQRACRVPLSEDSRAASVELGRVDRPSLLKAPQFGEFVDPIYQGFPRTPGTTAAGPKSGMELRPSFVHANPQPFRGCEDHGEARRRIGREAQSYRHVREDCHGRPQQDPIGHRGEQSRIQGPHRGRRGAGLGRAALCGLWRRSRPGLRRGFGRRPAAFWRGPALELCDDGRLHVGCEGDVRRIVGAAHDDLIKRLALG